MDTLADRSALQTAHGNHVDIALHKGPDPVYSPIIDRATSLADEAGPGDPAPGSRSG